MSSATSAPSTAPIPGAAISVENLIYRYSKQAQPVLKIANWQVAAGDKVFLSGQSGSGKSTLLNLLSGMIVPESGHLHILGAPLHALSGRKRDGFRAKHLGVVFQQFNLIEYLSVEQNLQAALWFSQNQQSLNPQPLNQGTLHSLFDTLQLPLATLKQKANQLSVGQQQRVAIARALIHDPELVIVDEPTSALDTDARDSFMQLLLASCQHKTVLFVSHDKSLASYFDQHISMQSLNRLQPTTGSQSC